ncbi:MAG: ATP-grasp domain-containing protein [Gemmatimonadales bacterium]|jgi:biotin carboxylase
MNPVPIPISNKAASDPVAVGGRQRLLLLIPTTTYRAEAFVEAARRLDVDLTVASEHDSTFSPAEPDRLLTLDFAGPMRAAEQVRAFAVEYPVTAVFGVDDGTAVVAAHASRALGIGRNQVEAVEAAANKHRQRVLLRDRGVPVPEFRVCSVQDRAASLADEVSYPCVLKPVALAASRGVIRVDDPVQFAQAFPRVVAIVTEAARHVTGHPDSEILIEDYVPGPEFALEGWLDEGRLTVLALFDKPDPLEGPYFAETIYVTPSCYSSDIQAALTACAESAARAIGLGFGPVHVELRYNENGPWLIELAARPIGGKCGQGLRFGSDGSVSLEELLLGKTLGLSGDSLEREASAVAVMMIPVLKAGIMKQVRGVTEALSVPHVTDMIITVHPGQELVPLPEESRYAGFIFARHDSPEGAESAVREAYACLDFVIE